jgi:hypothetical protein
LRANCGSLLLSKTSCVLGMHVAQRVATGAQRRARRQAQRRRSTRDLAKDDVAASKLQQSLVLGPDCPDASFEATSAYAAEQRGAGSVNVQVLRLQERSDAAAPGAMAQPVCSRPACHRAAPSGRDCIRATCNRVSISRSGKRVAHGVLPPVQCSSAYAWLHMLQTRRPC